MSNEEFQAIVKQWLETAREPRFKRPYTDLVYQPMLEVLAYLRANGFRTYIVSGGGQEFMRVYAERVYGIPPEQIIGSSIITITSEKAGTSADAPPKVFLITIIGKADGINLFIGNVPMPRSATPMGIVRCWSRRTAGSRHAARKCWCCTTTPGANTHTARRPGCPTPGSAPSHGAL